MSGVWPNGLRTQPTFTSVWMGYPGHYGLDMINFDINHAVLGGRVVTAGWSPFGGGYVVEVLADNGDLHRYLHNLRGLFVRVGQRVETGTPLARQGSTGLSTGKHLHFAVRVGGRWGKYVDPYPYLKRLVGTKLAGGGGTEIEEQLLEEDDMARITYRHSTNPKGNPTEYGIFGQTLTGGFRLSTWVRTGQAWGKMYGKPDGDSWGWVPWEQWLVMQSEAAVLNADWLKQLHPES